MATYYAVLELKDVDSQREADRWAEAISDAAQAPIVMVTREVTVKGLESTPLGLQFALKEYDGETDNEGQLVLYTGLYAQEDGSLSTEPRS